MEDFEQIYSQYFDTVYRYAFSLAKNKAIAEDVTQETFLKAIKSIDGFNYTCRMETWLCRIAKNTYFKIYEKNKRIQEFQDEPPIPCFEAKLANEDEAFVIHQILHDLEEPYKEVFSLRAFGELSFRQIGKIFGKTEEWARITYHRAKIKIKERML